MRAYSWTSIAGGVVVMPLIVALAQHLGFEHYYPSYENVAWYLSGAFTFWMTGKSVRHQ